VWQFRWSEKDLHGAHIQRKTVIGTVERYADGAAARTAMIFLLAGRHSSTMGSNLSEPDVTVSGRNPVAAIRPISREPQTNFKLARKIGSSISRGTSRLRLRSLSAGQ